VIGSLLRLRALGLANALAHPRSAAERAAVAIGAILIVLAVIGLVLFARDAFSTTPELRSAKFVTLGAVAVVAFWFTPLAFRIDDGLAPRAFLRFPIPPQRLAAGLAVTALASIPAVLLMLLVVIDVAAWARSGPGPAFAALLGGLLMLATALLGGLLAAALARGGIVARNVMGLIVLALVAVGAPFAALLTAIDWAAYGLTQLRRIASVLAWTPFGAGWAVPGDAATGNGGAVLLHLAIAVVAAGVLWLAWAAVVRHSVTTAEPRLTERERVGLGVFDALPDTQTGVVAARSVSYWLRDSRYVVPLLMLPVIPAAIVVAFWLAGVPWSAIVWIPVPLVCLLVGWGIHNDIAADGTAFWLHVVTSVRGRADRWGRVVTPLVIGVVVAVVGSFVTALLYGHLGIALPLIALSAAALGIALGVGSVASAVAPYATVAPGDSPFAQPQGATGGEAPKQAASLAISVLLCLPTIGLLVLWLTVAPGLLLATLITGFGSGVLALVLGTEFGALALRRRAPEILAFTQRN